MSLKHYQLFIWLFVIFASCLPSFSQELPGFVHVLVEAGELRINPEQLSVIPNHGIYLLTGKEMISLDGDEEIPLVHIPEQLYPESILFTEDDVLAQVDTAIISCKSKPSPIFAFDTNLFKMLPASDNSIFVTTRIDSISAIYHCDPIKRTIEPLIQLDEDIVLIAGDTTQCIIVTQYNIYAVQKRKALPLINYFEPIITATLTRQGIVFSTENAILLLDGVNSLSLIGDNGCRRLLSDNENLYIFFKDGSLVSYDLNQQE